MSLPDDSRLRLALEAIAAAAIPAAARRAWGRHAVEIFLHAPAVRPEPAPAQEDLGIVDGVRAIFRRHRGGTALATSAMVRELKLLDEAVGKRLQKASKVRNVRAHPDSCLLLDVERLLSAAQETGEMDVENGLRTNTLAVGSDTEPEVESQSSPAPETKAPELYASCQEPDEVLAAHTEHLSNKLDEMLGIRLATLQEQMVECVLGDLHVEACTKTELHDLDGIGVCTRTTGTITSRPRRRSVGTSTSLDNLLGLEATSDGHVPCSGTIDPAPAESAQRAQLDQGALVQHTAASLPVDQAVVRVAGMDMGRPRSFNDEDASAGAHPALPTSTGGHISDAKASADAGAVKVRVIEAGEYPPAFRARRRLLGDRGRFVHHIQDVTGASVWCRGSPLSFHLTSDSDEILDKAEHLVQNLVNTVAQHFEQWNKE